MVALTYAEHRSQRAKSFGMRRRLEAGAAETSAEGEEAPATKKREHAVKVAAEQPGRSVGLAAARRLRAPTRT